MKKCVTFITAVFLLASCGGNVNNTNQDSNHFTVTFKNDDGTVLYVENNVEKGTFPTYKGEAPTKESDVEYVYTFDGWNPALTFVSSDQIYVATYTREVRKYTVTWLNYDNTIIKTDQVPYGEVPVYEGETPTYESDEYYYEFEYWYPTPNKVKGDITYKAIYSRMAKLELSGIEITSLPDKTSYISGEEFESSGIEVAAIYSNSALTKKEVIDNYVIDLKDGYVFTMDDADETTKTVTISYEGFESSFNVTINHFQFSIKLQNKDYSASKLYVGDKDRVVAIPNTKDYSRNYTFSSSNPSVIQIDSNTGEFVALTTTSNESPVYLYATEPKSGERKTIRLYVEEKPILANGVYDFSSNNSVDKNEIISKLEENALQNFAGGISLYENSEMLRFSDRVVLGSNNYITDYGFGLIREGKLTSSNTKVDSKYKDYFLDSVEYSPGSLNVWTEGFYDDVVKLNDHITSSFWEKKLNSTKTDFEWTPVLALNENPIPTESVGAKHETWRVYLRTGEDRYGNLVSKENGGIYYRTSSNNGYDNRPVRAEDYVFVFKLLLQGRSYLHYGADAALKLDLKGAEEFNYLTRNKNANDIDAIFDQMSYNDELGVKLGWENNESSQFVDKPYIDFTFNKRIDSFTAKNSLSNKMFSPIPKSFLLLLGSNDYLDGAYSYGALSDKVLAVGPYYLNEWVSFTRNDDWFEVDEVTYQIPGIYYMSLNGDISYQFQWFEYGLLDVTRFPQSKIGEAGSGNDYRTVADSVGKLLVNTATQERWDNLYFDGLNRRTVKPWMSNRDFLKGLFWSIDRNNFARSKGFIPTVNYLADSVLTNATQGITYNSTYDHQEALKAFGIDPNDKNYGYDLSKAELYFKSATFQLIRDGFIPRGTAANPTIIPIDVYWGEPYECREYGNELANYFETAFNSACLDIGVQLKVNNQFERNRYDIYERLYYGDYDLLFEKKMTADTYNPLSYFELLTDKHITPSVTETVDNINPIIFKGERWSYDGLLSAYKGVTSIKDGVVTSPIDYAYMTPPTSDEEGTMILPAGDFRDGGYMRININCKEIDDLDLEINELRINTLSGTTFKFAKNEIHKIYDETGKLSNIYVYISPEKAEIINHTIAETDIYQTLIKNLDERYRYDQSNPTYLKERDELLHPFTLTNYDSAWNVSLVYTYSFGSIKSPNNYLDVYRSNIE